MKKVTSLGIRTRLTALLLVVCMSIAVLPGSVIALENDSINYSNEVNETANEDVNETLNETENSAEKLLEPIIIEEDITRRKANEKHFLCDDGSYIAISYPEAVHEEVNGEWVDVEYEVTENGGNISPVDEYIKVKFANNTNSAKLVKVEAGEYKISWTVEAETDTVNGIQKVKLSKDSKANIKTTKELVKENKDRIKANAKYTYDEVSGQKNNAKKHIENTDYAKISTLGNDTTVVTTNEMIESYNRDIIQSVSFAQSNVEYAGAFGEGTILRYLLTPGEINEEIVLESYNGFKSYSMVMDTDGLTPTVDGQNRVVLTDEEGSVVMTIAAPYMYDANDVVSNEITVTVTQESKKTWRITYAPDTEWLISSDRAYPVVIDPKVTTHNNPLTTQFDTYVYEGQTVSKGNSNTLLIGFIGGAEYISYWSSELPAYTSYSQMTGASFNIKLESNTTTIGTIGIYSVYSVWNENTMWNTRPNISSTALDVEGNIPSNKWLRFSSSPLSNMIADLENNSVPTISLAIAYDEYMDNYNTLYSTESANIPYLEIRYTINGSFSKISKDFYYIRNASTGKYLTVSNGSTASGTSVIQADFRGDSSQTWDITNIALDRYTIKPLNVRYMTLSWGSNQTPRIQNLGDSEWGQWRFEEVQDETYYISSLAEPWMVLDASLNGNTSVYIFPHKETINQRWVLEPVTQITGGNYYYGSINEGEEYWYKFIATENWTYSFESLGDVDTFGKMYLINSSNSIIYNDDQSTDNKNFYIEKEVVSGTSYYLCVSLVGDNGGEYQIGVSRYPAPYGQSKTGWCWAAASKLVAEHNIGKRDISTKPIVFNTLADQNTDNVGTNYNGDDTIDGVQAAIVEHIKGSPVNEGGDAYDDMDAMRFIAGDKSIDVGQKGGNSLSASDIEFMNNELSQGRYVLADVYIPTQTSTHAIVVKSYNESNGIYTYFDPDDNKDHYFTASQLANNTINGNERIQWFIYCKL